MIYFFLVISVYQLLCSGQYLNDIDSCIRTGINVNVGSVITHHNFTSLSCGFIMQSNPYIVLQPELLNLDENTVIKLFLISGNMSNLQKTLIHEYNGRFLFRDMNFIGQGYKRFALVVLRKASYYNIGQFRFVFRTNCYVEMAAEDYSLFNSPNFYPNIPVLNRQLSESSQHNPSCTYRIYSRTGKKFSVEFHHIRYSMWYNLLVNNATASVGRKYSYPGYSNIYVVLSTFGQTNSSDGFNASVEIEYQLRLVPINSDRTMGIPQIEAFGRTFFFQFGSLSNVDAHVMCLTLGFGGLRSISNYRNISHRQVIFHDFFCTGSEKHLSQCTPMIERTVSYRQNFYGQSEATVLSCSESFPIRLIPGISNSSRIVQVKIGNEWGSICGNNVDQNVGDVLCRELGFRGFLEINATYHYSISTNEVIMGNVRCGSHRNLRNCFYHTSSIFMNRINSHFKNYDYFYSRNVLINSSRHFSQCYNNRVITLTCRDNNEFSLVPGHFEGYLRYNDALVCKNSYAASNAAVFCRFLGYPGVRKIVYNGPNNWNSYFKINLMCNGNEMSPGSCPIDVNSRCPHNQVAGVVCQTVALAGSQTSFEGRVEVFYNGRRGLLCDDAFDINGGHVICRQLGFRYALNALQSAANTYGYGNMVYLLDDLRCNGNEESIHQCSHSPWGQHNCGGNEVSGLICAVNASEDSCGRIYVPEVNLVTSIGYQASIGANPWQVRLHLGSQGEWCSGTIINRFWIVTSANCLMMPVSQFYISTGSRNGLNSNSTYNVQNYFIHPNYSSITGDYNIALVKISTYIHYNSYIQPACLPARNFSINDSQCVTTGWNHRVSYNNGILFGKRVIVRNREYCMAYTGFDVFRNARYLCSDNSMDPSTIFNGESGGPLICTSNGRSTLAGVVSRSIHGARATNIRLFSRIDYYTQWIQSTIAQNQ